jgi:hypothetical protein
MSVGFSRGWVSLARTLVSTKRFIALVVSIHSFRDCWIFRLGTLVAIGANRLCRFVAIATCMIFVRRQTRANKSLEASGGQYNDERGIMNDEKNSAFIIHHSSMLFSATASTQPLGGFRKMSHVTERIFISLWCGVAIPFSYFLLLMVLDSASGDRLAGASGWLLLPLTWIGKTFDSLYDPTIRSVGDVLGAAFDVILVTLVGNVIFYSALAFVLLSVRTTLKRRGRVLV